MLWLGLMLALPALLIALLAMDYLYHRALTRRFPEACDEVSVCGKCGYAVRGLTTFNCPECGNDLREVGIIPPSRRTDRRTIVILSVTVATLLLCVLGCAGWFFAWFATA